MKMTKEEIVIKGPIAVGVAFLSYMTGLFSDALLILIVVMVIDYTTGLMRAILTRSLNSTIGLKGIFKKVAMILVVALSGCIEYLFLILEMDTKGALAVVVICFFIVNEGISVLENSGQLGAPIPEKLYTALSKLREVGGKEQKVAPKRKAKKEENQDGS